MCKRLLEWAKMHKNWTLGQWKNVFPMPFRSSRTPNKIRPQKRWREYFDLTPAAGSHASTKTDVLGLHESVKASTISFSKRMMKSDQYIQILASIMMPHLHQTFPARDGIFQQDLASCHTSRTMKKFFKTII